LKEPLKNPNFFLLFYNFSIKVRNILETVKKAIERYNKYHGSESKARLIDASENEIVVEFRGPFCTTCGFYDYFDDLAYELEDLGLKARRTDVQELEDGAVVKFRLEKRAGKSERGEE